jgi:hypothetical protein
MAQTPLISSDIREPKDRAAWAVRAISIAGRIRIAAMLAPETLANMNRMTPPAPCEALPVVRSLSPCEQESGGYPMIKTIAKCLFAAALVAGAVTVSTTPSFAAKKKMAKAKTESSCQRAVQHQLVRRGRKVLSDADLLPRAVLHLAEGVLARPSAG